MYKEYADRIIPLVTEQVDKVAELEWYREYADRIIPLVTEQLDKAAELERYREYANRIIPLVTELYPPWKDPMVAGLDNGSTTPRLQHETTLTSKSVRCINYKYLVILSLSIAFTQTRGNNNL